MIQIVVNGAAHRFEQPLEVTELLRRLELAGCRHQAPRAHEPQLADAERQQRSAGGARHARMAHIAHDGDGEAREAFSDVAPQNRE